MEIAERYKEYYEIRLEGRYINMQHIYPLLDMYKQIYDISIPGLSERGQDIPLIRVGRGKKKVLAWSQMHGNETTTTKAIFDFLKFISQTRQYQSQIDKFLQTHTLYIFPILNPDGAQAYSRENANGVDLNRDAQELSQRESKCLRQVFESIKPHLCLNMHDQRSIYGLATGKAATVSFLSPAADGKRSLTAARKEAMHLIGKMDQTLQNFIPGQIGRYDDSYNEACVGDTFQKAGVPTILFEAGHFDGDYDREKTREFIFYALLSLFGLIESDLTPKDHKNYFDIPENLKNYNDFILRNVGAENGGQSFSIAIQYEEMLRNGKIDFIPKICEIGNLENRYGHAEKDANGNEILTIPQDNLTVGANVSQIIDKNDQSIIYFQ